MAQTTPIDSIVLSEEDILTMQLRVIELRKSMMSTMTQRTTYAVFQEYNTKYKRLLSIGKAPTFDYHQTG